VNVYAVLPSGSDTARVGNSAISSFVGPANMSMTPLARSARIVKKNSPRPLTTL
jgi:hypothetical protein